MSIFRQVTKSLSLVHPISGMKVLAAPVREALLWGRSDSWWYFVSGPGEAETWIVLIELCSPT